MVERIQRFFRHQIHVRQRESFSELPVFFKDFCISDIAPADHALKIQTGCHKTCQRQVIRSPFICPWMQESTVQRWAYHWISTVMTLSARETSNNMIINLYLYLARYKSTLRVVLNTIFFTFFNQWK